MNEWIEIEEDILDTELDEHVEIGKKLALNVYTAEGNTAHFHFIKDYKEKTQAEGCIAMLAPCYFMHGSKTATLNSRQLKIIVSALKKSFTYGPANIKYERLWDYFIDVWNKGAAMRHTAQIVPVGSDIPKYKSDMDTIQESKDDDKNDSLLDLEVPIDDLGGYNVQ